MARLVQDVITNALENIGIVGAGGTPATADNTRCLVALQSVINSFINAGVMDELYDVIPNSNSTYMANENERIINDGTVTVTLPTTITQPVTFGDSDWDYGCGDSISYPQTRPPRDLAVVQVVNTATGARNTWVYDNWLRSWTDIENLTLTSVCPLAQRDADGLAAVLTERVADKFGQQVGPATALAARNFKAALATNWSQAGRVLKPGDYF